MAYRTTPERVAAIVELEEDTDDLEPFIDAANQLITDLCSASGYDAPKMERLEKWLSAHFYCVLRPRRVQEVTGKIQDTYQSKVDLRLQVTHYGQQVMLLDTDGNLAAWSNATGKLTKYPISLSWLGVTNQEEPL